MAGGPLSAWCRLAWCLNYTYAASCQDRAVKRRLRRAAIVLVLLAAWVAATTLVERRRLLPVLPGAAADSPQVDRATLLADVKALSSPALEGRRTGTRGGAQAR